MSNNTNLDSIVFQKVVLAGKEYEDKHYVIKPSVSAYIQCSWFSNNQMHFMEEGLKALAGNLTFNLANSHHPLSHQYNDINVNDHPEVMDDFEWQQSTYNMDITAMNTYQLGVGLYLPNEIDDGQGYEQGYLNAIHKPNLLVIPDDCETPLNLMVGMGNTQIIKLSELQSFDFNHDLIYKPFKGKVF
jgi:nucleoside deoxyribosyltransferase